MLWHFIDVTAGVLVAVAVAGFLFWIATRLYVSDEWSANPDAGPPRYSAWYVYPARPGLSSPLARVADAVRDEVAQIVSTVSSSDSGRR